MINGKKIKVFLIDYDNRAQSKKNRETYRPNSEQDVA